jgi:hypothetical protein
MVRWGEGGEFINAAALLTLVGVFLIVSRLLLFVHLYFSGSAVNRIGAGGVVTRLRTGQTRNRSSIPSGGKKFSFLRTVQSSLGSTKPSVQWVSGVRSPWGRVSGM